MENLLEVPPGKKVSEWERWRWRWRTGPSKASGPGLVKALSLVEEILASGLGRLELDPSVPQRRLLDLAKYELGARSAQLKRHPQQRQIATLVASVRRLETKTIDDALDLLMVTELLGKAQREADKQKVRRHPKLAKASARLALAVEVLLEAAEIGDEVALFEVWAMIEARIPRRELREAVETVNELVPPPGADDDGGWRAEMASRYPTVSGFVKVLTEVIEFGANLEGEKILAAMQALPKALAHKPKDHSATLLPMRFVDADVVTGVWKRLVFGHPARKDG
ncbi:hypothetical protein SAMN05216275_13366 [Streptosporangium canum]|uniref:Tn3 transposase DDE domain-containing protein n=1 Tax=Streptosporangium canum TaxID=324952 RepID=A0A1I4BWL0_9ACTN|nr:hypothetical protein SAMN05216275_13366 [Streptosporangium canum]